MIFKLAKGERAQNEGWLSGKFSSSKGAKRIYGVDLYGILQLTTKSGRSKPF